MSQRGAWKLFFVLAGAACTTETIIATQAPPVVEETPPQDGGYVVGELPPFFQDASAADTSTPSKDASSPTRGACGAVTANGRCATTKRLEICSTATGQGSSRLVSKDCADWEECVVLAKKALCVTLPGRCEPGASECSSTSMKRTCNTRGEWVAEACADCRQIASTTSCTGAVPTTTHTGVLTYEAREVNGGLTGWGPLTEFYANGVEAVSYHFDTATQEYVSIDAAIVGSDGEYTIRVATVPHPNDLIRFWAIWIDDSGKVGFTVAEPDIPDGVYDLANGFPPVTARTSVWGWDLPISELGANGSTTTVTEELGSGALAVFDQVRYSLLNTAHLLNANPADSNLIVWMRPNSEWSCGACFGRIPVSVEGTSFSSQMFIPMTARDQSYWSNPVTVHELGHWAMESYGTSPSEGGSHSYCTTFPGQAWSEGWATGYSSITRNDPFYYDKQEGTFFWSSIGDRVRSPGSPGFIEPKADAGLLQQLDEETVSAILFDLRAPTPADGDPFAANKALFDALTSPRMNTAPFKRGYTTHEWSGACEPRTNVVDTGISAPMFADYLDALVCGGFSTTKITSAIGAYPYSVANPVCQ